MTKHKNTKRALLMSVLSMLMCVAVLAGGTFAWFTDTATTGVNTIQAGTLDVVLEVYENGEWVDATGKSLDFIKAPFSMDDTILWEPGCTYELPQLRIRNAGNLALKFDVVITGIDGDAKLNEAIEWTYNYTVDYDDNWNGVIDENETVPAFDSLKHSTGGWALIPENSEGIHMGSGVYYMYLDISGHMKEDAGNEYQGLSIDGISITVVATQLDYEFDSSSNMYDFGAEYYYHVSEDGKTLTIDTAVGLMAFAEKFSNGEHKNVTKVVISDDIDLAGYDWKAINAWDPENSTPLTIDGQGNTISNMTVEGGSKIGFIGSNSRDITIQNLTFDQATVTTSASFAGVVIGYQYGDVVLNNVNVTNSVVNTTAAKGIRLGGLVGFSVLNDGATLTVTDCTVEETEVVGYHNVAGLVGTLQNYDDNTAKWTMTGNTVKDCTIIVTSGNVKYGAAFAVEGANYPHTYEQSNAYFTGNAESGNTLVLAVTTQEKLNEEIAAGHDVYLAPGIYTLPALTNKTVTIAGSKNAVIDTTDGFNSTTGADITFDGVTVKFANANYQGFTHAAKLVYKNCTIIGQQTLYAPAPEFINCTFEVEGDFYAVWTYGTNATFTDCTFNCDGKAVLVYTEGAVTNTVTFNNCVFNDNGDIAGKAAIEIGESAYGNLANYTININGCTVNGFEVTTQNANTFGGTNLGTTVWGNKNLMTADRLHIVIDGTEVY